jgi:hypothetical protein
VSVRWNTKLLTVAAEPLPKVVSVPDTGAALAVALCVAELLLLEDEHAPSAPTSAMAPVRAARFFVFPPCINFSSNDRFVTIRPEPVR